MAKRKSSDGNHGNNGASPEGDRPQGGETTAGYFRKVFAKHPNLLGEKSNKKLLARWLKDHPEATEVPKSIRANLANLKSVLRSQKRKKVAARAGQIESVAQQKEIKVSRTPSGSSKLERLEHQIDECIISAKLLDRDELANVIDHLRLARNLVVWKIGQ